MNINVLEIYKSTSDILERFIVVEKVSHIIYIVLFLFLLMLGNSFVTWIHKKIVALKSEDEQDAKPLEHKNELNLYKFYIFISLICSVVCFIMLFNHCYKLIECYYNPQYVYLKQLINLMK